MSRPDLQERDLEQRVRALESSVFWLAVAVLVLVGGVIGAGCNDAHAAPRVAAVAPCGLDSTHMWRGAPPYWAVRLAYRKGDRNPRLTLASLDTLMHWNPCVSVVSVNVDSVMRRNR